MDDQPNPQVDDRELEKRLRYRIEAPNAKFAGDRFGVNFLNGVGYTRSLGTAKAIAEPQFAGQTEYFKIIDQETSKQLFPILPGETDVTADDGTR